MYASLSEFHDAPASQNWIRMREIWKFAYPFATDTFGCKFQEAEKLDKFADTYAWKAFFHISCVFFATLWLASKRMLSKLSK